MKWPWQKQKVVPKKDESLKVADIWPTFGRDKCDKCPSQAKVRVFIPHTAMILDFCAHHFRKNHKKFDELGYMWIDARHEKEKFTKTLQDISGDL